MFFCTIPSLPLSPLSSNAFKSSSPLVYVFYVFFMFSYVFMFSAQYPLSSLLSSNALKSSPSPLLSSPPLHAWYHDTSLTSSPFCNSVDHHCNHHRHLFSISHHPLEDLHNPDLLFFWCSVIFLLSPNNWYWFCLHLNHRIFTPTHHLLLRHLFNY